MRRPNKKAVKVNINGSIIEEFCKPLSKAVVISKNDETFTFIAYLEFNEKDNIENKFEPTVICTWEIDLLPILQAYAIVDFQC
jgi:hypothetical protein